MRVLRSFPDPVPQGRAYVADGLERLIQTNYDYTPLGLACVDDDVVIIEWDMALADRDLRRFLAHASLTPVDVLVAPQWLYHVAGGPQIGHRVVDGCGVERWVTPHDDWCDLFAFGLIYFPRRLVHAFLAAPAPQRGRSPFLPADIALYPYDDCRFTDQTFSMWHRYTLGRRARIDWSVWPVHLHAASAA